MQDVDTYHRRLRLRRTFGLLIVWLGISAVGAAFVVSRILQGETFQVAMTELGRCELAASTLGDSVHIPLQVPGGGQTPRGAATDARRDHSVVGTTGRGRYSWHLTRAEGQWQLVSGTLHVDDVAIDVLSCEVIADR